MLPRGMSLLEMVLIDELTKFFPNLAIKNAASMTSVISMVIWRTIDLLISLGEAGAVVNPEKFQFAQQTVEFAGFRITPSSTEPLSKYLDAIRNFPTHKSTSDIRSWFGLVNQVSNYAQLRDLMAPFKPFLSPRC